MKEDPLSGLLDSLFIISHLKITPLRHKTHSEVLIWHCRVECDEPNILETRL